MVCINDEDEADEEDEAVVSYGYLLVAFAFLQLSHFCDDYKNDIIDGRSHSLISCNLLR
jgi:hypothetical protein